VQTGERSYVVVAGTDERETKPIYPHVAIEKAQPEERGSHTGGAVAVAEPAVDTAAVTMRAFIDEQFREGFIEIYAADARPRLITCIEVLSPANKSSRKKGWKL